jgi:hypothetical protein
MVGALQVWDIHCFLWALPRPVFLLFKDGMGKIIPACHTFIGVVPGTCHLLSGFLPFST